MQSRSPALIILLAASYVALGATAHAIDLNGPWATDATVCSKVFVKNDSPISFQKDSDRYGGGFIMEGNSVRGQMRAGAGSRGNTHRNKKCEQDLAKIIGFARIRAKKVPQRPLQEQQQDQRQRQPLRAVDHTGNCTVESSSPVHGSQCLTTTDGSQSDSAGT